MCVCVLSVAIFGEKRNVCHSDRSSQSLIPSGGPNLVSGKRNGPPRGHSGRPSPQGHGPRSRGVLTGWGRPSSPRPRRSRCPGGCQSVPHSPERPLPRPRFSSAIPGFCHCVRSQRPGWPGPVHKPQHGPSRARALCVPPCDGPLPEPGGWGCGAFWGTDAFTRPNVPPHARKGVPLTLHCSAGPSRGDLSPVFGRCT